VRSRVAIVYNKPVPSRYDLRGEEEAVDSILGSVRAAEQALLKSGYDVVQVPLVPPLEEARRELRNLTADLVFNLFEGFSNQPETEAVVAEIISELDIPYSGCSPEVLALALDKARTKAILEEAGFVTPRYQLLGPETLPLFHLSYPCIVKPCGEDASHGLSEESVVYDFISLEKQVGVISNFYGQALVEEFIDGQEFNATVFGDSERTVLPVSEIVYSLPAGMPRILTFAAKWEPDSLYFRGSRVVCPAQIPDSEREHIAETARAVFRLFCSQGYARMDMRSGRGGQLYIIEVNPNPDISPDSGAVRQAGAAGMSYAGFITKIALLALEKSQR
jgi:D-alanine-D-alanine ligase